MKRKYELKVITRLVLSLGLKTYWNYCGDALMVHLLQYQPCGPPLIVMRSAWHPLGPWRHHPTEWQVDEKNWRKFMSKTLPLTAYERAARHRIPGAGPHDADPVDSRET